MITFLKALIALPEIIKLGYKIQAMIRANRNERHYRDLVKWTEDLDAAKTEDDYKKAARDLRDRMSFTP